MTDLNFNWEVPKKSKRVGAAGDPDFLVVKRTLPKEHGVQWNNFYFKFPRAAVKKYLNNDPEETNHIAISLEENMIVAIFNPTNKDIPAIKLSKSTKDRLSYNIKLINKFYDHFNIDKKTVQKFFLKIHDIGKHGDMQLYALTPYNEDYQPILPIEKEGKLFEK